MKKVIAVLICIILMCSFTVGTVNAQTTKKEWSRMTGPADFAVSKEGVSLSATEGLTFYKYTKDTVDINNFSCTFSLDQENYWDGHDGEHGYYYSIILTNKAAHSGSQGLFLLLFPMSGRSLRIEAQILNTGYLLHPTYVEFDVDTTSALTMHGKVNGNNYEISFDNCKDTYKFEIPVNYQFHKDLDGQAYFGFGANVSEGDESIKMTVTKVNDIEMLGEEEAPASSQAETDSNANTEAVTNTNANAANGNNVTQSGTQNVDSGTISTMFIILIATVAFLFLVVVAGFVFIAIFLNKKTR